MKKLLPIVLLSSLALAGCQTGLANQIQMSKGENTKSYTTMNDPTYGRVHSFEFGSECGNLKRGTKSKYHIGKWDLTDCGSNSVRSELSEKTKYQPKESWYKWNVFLPEDFPIQDGGKLLLGQWHNGECPHVSFTSPGKANGVLYFETMKTWQGDCKNTVRIPFTSIQELRGKWTEFVMFARWSNKDDGIFKIYLNGSLVLDFKGRTITKGKEHSNYLKIGIYQCCNGNNQIKPADAMFTTPQKSKTSLLPK